MKKVLFAAIAVCGFAFANAQVVGPNATASASTAININIEETVEVVPSYAPAYSLTFNEAGHFETFRDMGMRSWYIHSTNAGVYTVSFDRGNIPAAVVLQYKVEDWAHGTPVANNVDIATPTSSPFYSVLGTDNGVGLYGWETYVTVKAKVPWGVMAGNYTGTMTLTATTE
jgi:hypothetical protein